MLIVSDRTHYHVIFNIRCLYRAFVFLERGNEEKVNQQKKMIKIQMQIVQADLELQFDRELPIRVLSLTTFTRTKDSQINISSNYIEPLDLMFV